jgi:integrase
MFQRGRSYYVRLFEGGRDRWVSLGRDYEEASRQLERLRRGETLAPELSVGEAAQRWLESYVRTSRNEDGQKLAGVRVKRYLLPFMGERRVSGVRREDLRAYRLWLGRRGLADQTVAHVLSDARCFFGWAEDTGLTEGSPVPKRLLPRIQDRPPDRLADAEVEALVGLPEPYGFAIRLALGTGMRWGELCRTQAGDMERGMLVVSHTKAGRVRRVPIPPELLAELRRRVGLLVPFPRSSLASFTRTARRLSGVQRFHVHQLRHTFACRWLERGGSLAALQQVLGHSTVVTTQRYARLDEDAIRREAEKVQTVADSVANGPREEAPEPVAPASRARL